MGPVCACPGILCGDGGDFAEVLRGGARASQFLECHHLQTGVAHLLYLITNLEL